VKRPTPNAQRRTRSAEPPNRRTAEPPNRPARTKVKSLAAAVRAARAARPTGRRVVFTNGCFDLVHRGHVRYLERARSLGDLLVVAINSDRSVRRLKGPSRPVVPEAERAEVLAALQVVDVVLVFDDPTPARVIEAIQPDVLVKGGDWPVSRIVGAEFVQSRGGTVLSLPYFAGGSTTALIHRIAAGRVRK
jgi:rfaE bifunctional protein nucleotidyltransferase chain/domain